MSPPRTPPDADGVDCQQCGAAVEPTANFCPQCGTEIRSQPVVCRDCGEPFVDGAAFCSHCGTAREGGSKTSRTGEQGETHEQFRRRVAAYTEADWEITADHGDRVTVVDREIGSIGVHVLLLLFTSGFGNLLYGWYHYSKLAERRHLSVGGSTPAPAEPTPTQSTQQTTTTAPVMAYVASLLLWFISLSFLVVAIGGSSVAAGLIGLLFAAAGSYVLPPVRHRLGRRHEVTMFGRHKTVDHRIIPQAETCDEPCVVCGDRVSQGLLRRRRDETLIAGVPVSTHNLDMNHYCLRCARDENLIDDTDSAEPTTATERATASNSAGD